MNPIITNGAPELKGQIDRAADRLLTEVVDQAVAPIEGEERRLAVRESVTTILRETFAELAARPDMLLGGGDGGGMLVLGDTRDDAEAFASGVKQLTPSFVEFTAGLITGTFDALIAATVKQMEAYAALVKDLAKTVSEFSQENITDAEVFNYLVQRWPNPRWNSGTANAPEPLTRVSVEYKWNSTGAPAGESTAFMQDVAALITQLKASDTIKEPSGADAKLGSDDVATIKSLVRKLIGANLMDHLRAMAREGMARIVVTDGEILTKLTFQMTGTEIQQSVKTQYDRLSANASLSAGARAPWGSVRANAGVGKLSVRTVNEQSFDKSTMSGELIGQVRIHFKTETFTPIDVPAKE
jgi:hypothetical protein